MWPLRKVISNYRIWAYIVVYFCESIPSEKVSKHFVYTLLELSDRLLKKWIPYFANAIFLLDILKTLENVFNIMFGRLPFWGSYFSKMVNGETKMIRTNQFKSTVKLLNISISLLSSSKLRSQLCRILYTLNLLELHLRTRTLFKWNILIDLQFFFLSRNRRRNGDFVDGYFQAQYRASTFLMGVFLGYFIFKVKQEQLIVKPSKV